MELFAKAKTVRLRTIRDKYLIAQDDQENVCQDRDGSSTCAFWGVDFVPGENFIRLKSCYGKYLTASNVPFLPGVTGKKVLQTRPAKDDKTVDWEPLRDGMQVRLRSRSGNFLRPNGGLPPWRNSVTHDIPHRSKTQEKVLWDVDVVEALPSHRRMPPEKPADPVKFNKSSSTSAVPTNPQGQKIIRTESTDSKEGDGKRTKKKRDGNGNRSQKKKDGGGKADAAVPPPTPVLEPIKTVEQKPPAAVSPSPSVVENVPAHDTSPDDSPLYAFSSASSSVDEEIEIIEREEAQKPTSLNLITPRPSKNWSIHTRQEIIAKYQILERIGSGSHSDVYKARRLSDSLIVALKEVHDLQSAFREIEALQILHYTPNVVYMHEYFWSEDEEEDAVLVLEYLQTDLASVIRNAKKEQLDVGERKRWIVQILSAVDACHQNSIVHRDLTPSNMLISAAGVLKLAGFGQARVIVGAGDHSSTDNEKVQAEEIAKEITVAELPESIPEPVKGDKEGEGNQEEEAPRQKDCDEHLEEVKDKEKDAVDHETEKGLHADTSCVSADNIIEETGKGLRATRSCVSDYTITEETEKGLRATRSCVSAYTVTEVTEKGDHADTSCVSADSMNEEETEKGHRATTSCVSAYSTTDVDSSVGEELGKYGPYTSCVGTRWFRSPELLYGSSRYGPEIDLWSVGCILAELLSSEPIFPGTSDIDQLSIIFDVLGNLSEEAWPGCLKLPNYKRISFGEVENPRGIEACLPSCSPDEINLVKKLLRFDPASRATAMELLQETYLNEEPLPVPISELRIPSSISAENEGCSAE